MARILCVDDEPNVVTLYTAILEAAGHAGSPSLTVEDAIVKLEANKYDLVLTGWHINGPTGQGVISTAKEKGIQVIVISGYAEEARALASPPADLYLTKPVNPGELLNLVEGMYRRPPLDNARSSPNGFRVFRLKV